MQIKYPQIYEGKRSLQRWPLLCGPSGTDKSYLSEAVECELPKKQNNFVPITLDKFLNKS